MSRSLRNLCAVLIVSLLSVASTAAGDVVVLTNRTKEAVSFHVQPPDGVEKAHRIPAGELVSIPVTGPLKLSFGAEQAEHRLLIDPNSVCFFYLTDEGKLELSRIGFADEKSDGQTPPPAVGSSATVGGLEAKAADPFASDLCTIPVKIFVDDEEPFTQKLWEKRLRKRIGKASDILEQHCRVRFEVVAVDTWDSENGILDFSKLLAEFEREVRVQPAALAIGFTSQKLVLEPRTRLGGTFAPLRNYILIREWSKHMSEPERLEVLLHELGHYLGATHSPEPNSAMRPQLNDGKAILRSFRMGFDPVNTLIMCLVGEEIKERKVRHLKELSPRTRKKLQSIYREIAKITPDEPATIRLLQLVSENPQINESAKSANGNKK